MKETFTPGPWDLDWDTSEGGYGRTKTAKLVDASGRTICDTQNSDVAEIMEEIIDDEGGIDRWDEQGRVNMALLARLFNLYSAGVRRNKAQEAAIAAAGMVPPDLEYGLTEGEVSASLMMNALMDENEALRKACRYIVDAGETGDEMKAIEMARAALSKVEGNDR